MLDRKTATALVLAGASMLATPMVANAALVNGDTVNVQSFAGTSMYDSGSFTGGGPGYTFAFGTFSSSGNQITFTASQGSTVPSTGSGPSYSGQPCSSSPPGGTPECFYGQFFTIAGQNVTGASLVSGTGGFASLTAGMVGAANNGAFINLLGETFVSGDTYTIQVTAAPVPLPAAVWLLGTGLIGLVGLGRRRRQ